jgi:hypothetical protein
MFLPVFCFDINETAESKFGVTIAPPAAKTTINTYTKYSFLKKGKTIKDNPDMNNPNAICFFVDKNFSP